MTSALSRPFDRFMVGMFLEMFHTLCQPLLCTAGMCIAFVIGISILYLSVMIHQIVSLVCDVFLARNSTCFTRLLRLLSLESKRLSPRMYQGVVSLLPLLLLPHILTHTLGKRSCLIWRNKRHGRSFRTLQFLSCVLNDVVVIGVLWRNVADTSQLTCSNQSTLSSSCFPSLWCAELWPVFHSHILRPFG